MARGRSARVQRPSVGGRKCLATAAQTVHLRDARTLGYAEYADRGDARRASPSSPQGGVHGSIGEERPTVDTATARRQLADLVSRVLYTKQRITLTRYGKACAALVPVEELVALRRRARSTKTKLKKASAASK